MLHAGQETEQEPCGRFLRWNTRRVSSRTRHVESHVHATQRGSCWRRQLPRLFGWNLDVVLAATCHRRHLEQAADQQGVLLDPVVELGDMFVQPGVDPWAMVAMSARIAVTASVMASTRVTRRSSAASRSSTVSFGWLDLAASKLVMSNRPRPTAADSPIRFGVACVLPGHKASEHAG